MTAFDVRNPPEPDLIDDCVHCGFCLPTCPTYALWGEEMDSPRGRILLIDRAERGEAGLDAQTVQHLDSCLGCMACVTACPSGVRYDRLIEEARAQVERRFERPPAERARRQVLFAVLPHRRRLAPLAAGLVAYRASGLQRALRRSGVRDRLPAPLRAAEALAPTLPAAALGAGPPLRTPPRGPRRLRVALLLGCVQRAFFGDVNAATARVLAAYGCEVVAPGDQGCCGALELHAGRDEPARERAWRLVSRLERLGADVVVTNAAGCGSALKEYGHLLADEPEHAAAAAAFAARVRDVSEVLADLEPPADLAPLRLRVAYHDACHLRHAQGVADAPRAVLAAIPGLALVELAERDLCCGSAGVYNLLQPATASELGERKAANVVATGAEVLVTANPGCLMQIKTALEVRGTPLQLLHTVELLDASINGQALTKRT